MNYVVWMLVGFLVLTDQPCAPVRELRVVRRVPPVGVPAEIEALRADVGVAVLLVDADPAGSGPDHWAGVGAGSLLPPGSPCWAGRPRSSAERVIGCCLAFDEASTRMVLLGVVDALQARPLAATPSALADVVATIPGDEAACSEASRS